MKVSRHTILYLLAVASFVQCKKDPLIPVLNPLQKQGWELAFNDEFDGPLLDRSKWRHHADWGQNVKDENQHLNIDSAFSILDGVLRIEAKRQDTIGLVRDENFNLVPKSFKYTSGLIHSASSFKQHYGYFEIRCKPPVGKGYWTTFWLLHDRSWPPEVDILEFRSVKPHEHHMSFHCQDANGKKDQFSKKVKTADLTENFHTYALEWNPDDLIWYFDNRQVFKTKNRIPDGNMYILASLAVGGNWSEYADETTPTSAFLEIDYIRAYRRNAGP